MKLLKRLHKHPPRSSNPIAWSYRIPPNPIGFPSESGLWIPIGTLVLENLSDPTHGICRKLKSETIESYSLYPTKSQTRIVGFLSHFFTIANPKLDRPKTYKDFFGFSKHLKSKNSVIRTYRRIFSNFSSIWNPKTQQSQSIEGFFNDFKSKNSVIPTFIRIFSDFLRISNPKITILYL